MRKKHYDEMRTGQRQNTNPKEDGRIERIVKPLFLLSILLLSGCFSMLQSGLGKMSGGSGKVSLSAVCLDVVTLPVQVVVFTVAFIDWSFESLFTEKGRLSYALENGATASFDIMVKDENGNTVSNAMVEASYVKKKLMRPSIITGVTDGEGKLKSEGITYRPVGFDVFYEGYYPSHKDFSFTTFGKDANKVTWGGWQPKNIPIEVSLRKIDSPHAAKASNDGEKFFPRLNEWFGFDLEVNDFTAPNGSGSVADVELKIVSSESSRPWYLTMALETRFTTPSSGAILTNKVNESDFKLLYNAPVDQDYKKALRFCSKNSQMRREGDLDAKDFSDNDFLIVRSRCKTDDSGVLTEARYFAITSVAYERGNKPSTYYVRFAVVYNPSPNDTSLEDSETFDNAVEKTRERRSKLP